MSSGWRDFGYNFAVDKCGNIYEGRAGGVAKPVLGAHTLGFNTDSMGIAVLGTYSHDHPAGRRGRPPSPSSPPGSSGCTESNPRGKRS